MRELHFDQFEFDNSSSEEMLDIHVSKKVIDGFVPYKNIHEFVIASAGRSAAKQLSGPKPYNNSAIFSSVREYLKRFASITVPDPCDWEMYVLLIDDLEWDGFFETPEMYIRYHWLSTA